MFSPDSFWKKGIGEHNIGCRKSPKGVVGQLDDGNSARAAYNAVSTSTDNALYIFDLLCVAIFSKILIFWKMFQQISFELRIDTKLQGEFYQKY